MPILESQFEIIYSSNFRILVNSLNVSTEIPDIQDAAILQNDLEVIEFTKNNTKESWNNSI